MQVIVSFKPHGHLAWWRKEGGETLAKAAIIRKQKWEILEPYDEWQRFRSVATIELEEILKDLHKNKEFQKVKKEFEDKGYNLAKEEARGILNETKREYLLWLRWQRQAVGGSAMRAIPLRIFIITLDDCLELCTLCVGAPSFLSPACWGCAGCIAFWVGAVAGGTYATYHCVSQCKGQ